MIEYSLSWHLKLPRNRFTADFFAELSLRVDYQQRHVCVAGVGKQDHFCQHRLPRSCLAENAKMICFPCSVRSRSKVFEPKGQFRNRSIHVSKVVELRLIRLQDFVEHIVVNEINGRASRGNGAEYAWTIALVCSGENRAYSHVALMRVLP